MEKYLQRYEIKPVKIGNANTYLIDVKSLVDFAVPIFTDEAIKYQC